MGALTGHPVRPRLQPCWSILLLFHALVVCPASATYVDKFDVCKKRFHDYGGLQNQTMFENGWVYTDYPRELAANFDRDNYTTLTYKGCTALCSLGDDDAQLVEPTFALNMVTTWIFPLAIVLSLPYESLHKRKKRGTFLALLNWLGSPQTALTSTIFNFYQIKAAHMRYKDSGSSGLWRDIYYVATCFNQFDFPASAKQSKLYETLMYGLFHPTIASGSATMNEPTGELIITLAKQLRLLRRRAVMPTLASLGTFLAAFIFSVVLSFAQVDNHTRVDLLVVGLFFSWLPALVITTIVDRNPVSSDRVRELMSRWLYNVNALRSHTLNQGQVSNQHQNQNQNAISWWTGWPPGGSRDPFEIGQFIGQGRKMQYCGLSRALMQELDRLAKVNGVTDQDYKRSGHNIRDALQSCPPWSWYAIAIFSLAVVWVAIGMAMLLAFYTPTIGLGCWSGAFLIYGTLSTITWLVLAIQCFFTPKCIAAQKFCGWINSAALGWLIVVIFFMLTGATNTCYCRSIHFLPGYGDYMNLENAKFYRDHCHVLVYWGVAAGVGLGVPLTMFVTALWMWRGCQDLWNTNEMDTKIQLPNSSVNWAWLT